ncbi:hypothetical protein ABES02_28600 [Neobacillus pocheonensis]
MGWMSLIVAFFLRLSGGSLSIEVRKGEFILKLTFGRNPDKP